MLTYVNHSIAVKLSRVPTNSKGSGDRLHLALLILLHESLMTIELHGPRESKKTCETPGEPKEGAGTKPAKTWWILGIVQDWKFDRDKLLKYYHRKCWKPPLTIKKRTESLNKHMRMQSTVRTHLPAIVHSGLPRDPKQSQKMAAWCCSIMSEVYQNWEDCRTNTILCRRQTNPKNTPQISHRKRMGSNAMSIGYPLVKCMLENQTYWCRWISFLKEQITNLKWSSLAMLDELSAYSYQISTTPNRNPGSALMGRGFLKGTPIIFPWKNHHF